MNRDIGSAIFEHTDAKESFIKHVEVEVPPALTAELLASAFSLRINDLSWKAAKNLHEGCVASSPVPLVCLVTYLLTK